MAQLRISGVSVAPGKQTVIHMKIARLASGTQIELPVYVYRGAKDGPTVLLSGGLHGDEVNGIEIVRRLIVNKAFDTLRCGTVVAIPVMNVYGFLQFSRQVPDGKDVNRSFPGQENGSLASRVAWFLTRNLLSVCDVGIDFHTGGASRYNFPQVRYEPGDTRAAEMALAFGAPVRLESKLIARSLRHQAHKMGKSILVYEGGESLRMDEEVIRKGMEGALRVLAHFGMVYDTFGPLKTTSVLCTGNTWVRAREAGLLNLQVKSGALITRNQVLGTLTDPFGTFKKKITSRAAGFILGHNNAAVVNHGDALLHVGLLASPD